MKKKISQSLVFALFIVSFTPFTYVWKETTHKEHLTCWALRLIERMDREKYGELCRNEFVRLIEQGSHDEDFPCGFSGIRANNHYRHALSGVGLTCSAADDIGLLLQKASDLTKLSLIIPDLSNEPDVDALTWAKTNAIFDESEEFNLGKEWIGFNQEGWALEDVSKGDMSWMEAVNRYGYKDCSKKLAYYTLGFVMHLLEDMGVPEHVHDDPHGASGYNGFEMWVHENWYRLTPRYMSPKRFSGPNNENITETIDDFFINLSLIAYSVDRFQGKTLVTPPYLDPESDLGKMFNADYDRKNQLWILKNKDADREEIKQSLISPGMKFDINNMLFHPHKLKAYNLGEWWPTSLETYSPFLNRVYGDLPQDRPGFYYIELSGEAPNLPLKELSARRHLYPAAYLPTPLESVKTLCPDWEKWRIDRLDGKTHLYEILGKIMFPIIVEYAAGFAELYYDIVNHPPYVKSVEIYQTTKTEPELKYYKVWKDDEESVSEKIKRVKGRSWDLEKEEDWPFEAAGICDIAIVFSEPVKDVSVRIGNRALKGYLYEDDCVWKGQFALSDESDTVGNQQISIKAKDKNRHYAGTGADLDKNPRTPAKRICEFQGSSSWKNGKTRDVNLGFYWEGYEDNGGVDTNHRILVESEDKYVLVYCLWPNHLSDQFTEIFDAEKQQPHYSADRNWSSSPVCRGTAQIMKLSEFKEKLPNMKYKDDPILDYILHAYITGEVDKTAPKPKPKKETESKSGDKVLTNKDFGIPSTREEFMGYLSYKFGIPHNFKNPDRMYQAVRNLQISAIPWTISDSLDWDEAIRNACKRLDGVYKSRFGKLEFMRSADYILIGFDCLE